jgi:integrase
VLRRTFDTLSLESGVDQVVLRSQMGHSSPAMTSRYAGVRVERKQAAVDSPVRLASGEQPS